MASDLELEVACADVDTEPVAVPATTAELPSERRRLSSSLRLRRGVLVEPRRRAQDPTRVAYLRTPKVWSWYAMWGRPSSSRTMAGF